MKKQLFLSLIIGFIVFTAYAQKQNVVRVKTVDQFVKAIASNTIIEMEQGLYQLNMYDSASNPEYGGRDGFYVKEISNLTIKGIGKYPAELILDDNDLATVIIFANCTGINLENVEIGHGASKGSCMGAVIGLKNTQNVGIKNSVLYGSGTYGIESTDQSGKIVCEKTIFRSCTNGAMSLYNTNDAVFKECTFVDNSDWDIFDFNNCKNIVFNDCVIKDNRGEASQYSSKRLFNVEGDPITLNNCLVKFNSLDYLANKMGVLKLNNTKIEANLFSKGEYENK